MMVARSGDEAIVKHILRIPPVTEDEINETKVQLDSIRKQVVAGSITFGAAVTKYSDDESTKYSAGALSGRDPMGNPTNFITIDQVDKDLAVLLPKLQPGDYSEPQVYVDERGRKVVRIVYLKARTNPHRENLNEDYNRIAQRALELKKNTALEKWFKEHIPTYFVSIDKDFVGCSGLDEWRQAANRAEQARTAN
jgi:peptidyl-prolyl cis-trans isomerase SurA